MRSKAPALLLVVAALAAWLLWRRAEPVPIESEPGAALDGGSATSAPSPPGQSSEAADTIREPDAADGAAPAPLDQEWVDGRVIDWSSRAPVAGADVWWMRTARWEWIDAMSEADQARYRADPELTVRTFGQHTTADRHGRVRVHADREITDVVARRDGRVGWKRITVRNAGSGVVLEISRELAVGVRVVDPAASPVPGVPVELRISSGASPRETDAAEPRSG